MLLARLLYSSTLRNGARVCTNRTFGQGRCVRCRVVLRYRLQRDADAQACLRVRAWLL